MKNWKYSDLPLAVTIVISAVVILTTLSLIFVMRNELRRQSMSNVTEVTEQSVEVLRAQLNSELQHMSTLASSPEWRTSPENAMKTVLGCVSSDSSMYMYTTDGECFPEGVQPDSRVLKKLSDVERGTGVIEPHISDGNGLNVFDVYCRLTLDDGKRAYLVKELKVDSVAGSFSPMFYEGEGTSYVIAGDGRILMRSDNAVNDSVTYISSVLTDHESVGEPKKLIYEMLAGKRGWSIFTRDGEKLMACYIPLGFETDWYITTVIPMESVDQRTNGLVMHTVATIIFVVICIFLLAATIIAWVKKSNLRYTNQSDYLANLFDAVPEGIAQISLDEPYQILQLNAEARRLLGIGEGIPYCGRYIEEFVCDEPGRDIGMVLREIAVSNEKYRFERRMQRTDGSLFWGSGVVEHMKDSKGVDIFIATFHDITADKLFLEQARLRQQHERRLLVAAISDAYPLTAIIDPECGEIHFIYLNPTVKLNMHGKSSYRVFYDELLSRVDQDMQQKFVEYFEPDALKRNIEINRTNLLLEFRALLEDGQFHWVSMQMIYVDDGGQHSAICLIRQADHQRSVQEYRRRIIQSSLDATEAANIAKSRFLANVTHDFRAPMNVIMSTAALMSSKTLPKEQTDSYLKTIRLSGQHLLQLVDNILNMSEIENGRVTLHEEPFKFSGLVNDAVDILRPEAQTIGVKLELNNSVPEDIVVVGDMIRLRQVYLNIIGNALKYSPHGCVKVSAECVPISDGYNCVFRCDDNGAGMSEEFMKRLFKPFERANDALVFATSGSGLGLAISHSMIRLMGGCINVRSALKKGSSFTVTVPLAAPSDDSGSGADDKHGEIPDLTGMRILFVDDMPMNCVLGKAILKETHAEVVTSENGEDAFELFRTSAEDYFDVVMLDIRMPDMSGYELARMIRSLERKDAGKIPMIAVTAGISADDYALAASAGMDYCLAKPYEPDKIFELLKKLYRSKEALKNTITSGIL